MRNSHFSIDRFTILLIGMTATLPFLAISPAMAAPTQAACQVEAQTIRDAAEGISPERAARAVRNANLGEKICAAGNPREASRKFAQARVHLNPNVALADNR